MPLGIQEYTEEGKFICAICGKAYKKLISHVHQAHNTSGDEYREKFGFCKSRTFICKESKELARKRVFENPHCIEINLKEKGKATRVKKGHKRFNHVMTEERYIILAKARAKQNLTKLKTRCLDCGCFISSRKGMRCKECYKKVMIKRNKEREK